MKAILLAAGLGQRLRPLTNDIPKCLVPICDKPLLQYWFELLLNGNVGPLLVNTHYFADRVKAFIDNYPDCSKIQTVYEKNLLGTGGTLLSNAAFVGNDSVMLIHADNLSYFDVEEFLSAHNNRPEQCVLTMMTFKTNIPETCGILEIDRQGVVQKMHEKVQNPPGNMANAAVYIIEPEVLDFIRGMDKRIIDFSTEVVPHFLGKIFTYHNGYYHRDSGNMDSYVCAQSEYKEFLNRDLNVKKSKSNSHVNNC